MARVIRAHWDTAGTGVGELTVVVSDAVLLLESGSFSVPDTLALLVSVPVVEESTETVMIAVVEALGARAPMSQVTVPPDSLQPDEAELKVTLQARGR